MPPTCVLLRTHQQNGRPAQLLSVRVAHQRTRLDPHPVLSTAGQLRAAGPMQRPKHQASACLHATHTAHAAHNSTAHNSHSTHWPHAAPPAPSKQLTLHLSVPSHGPPQSRATTHLQRGGALDASGVPHAHCGVVAAAGERPAVGAPRHESGRTGVSLRRQQQWSAGCMPYLEGEHTTGPRTERKEASGRTWTDLPSIRGCRGGTPSSPRLTHSTLRLLSEDCGVWPRLYWEVLARDEPLSETTFLHTSE
jgi:hypothetical protein